MNIGRIVNSSYWPWGVLDGEDTIALFKDRDAAKLFLEAKNASDTNIKADSREPRSSIKTGDS